MRAYLTAGLVSLSCATCGSAVLGQQPLWFTPQTLSPTHSTATPGSIPQSSDQAADRNWLQAISKSPQTKTEPLNRGTKVGSDKVGSDASAPSKSPSSMSQRFGDLLSKPGTRLAIAMGNEQATVVTAGAEDPSSSTTPSGIPWETVRKPNEFSFAEFDASVAQSQILGARRTRSTQVSEMTPQVPSLQQDTQPITEQVNTATVESNDSEQPTQRVPAQLASSVRPQRVASEDLSLVLPIPADKLVFQAPTEAPGKQTAVGNPSRSGERLEDVSAPLVRTMETSRVARLPQQDTSVNDNVPQAPKALETPNSTPPEPLESTNPTRTEPPVVGRISDMTSDDESNEPNSDSDNSTRNSAVDETPLLNTESMIGPMKGADQLFGRLDLVTDLRGLASLAQEGPREDSYQCWMPTPYTWISPAFYHHPLYFEQPNLERYGIGRARVVQPLLSSVHFFGSIPLIPYKTLTHHPRERVYTLGQGRPGNCVPIQSGVILGQSTVGEVSMFWEECSGYR